MRAVKCFCNFSAFEKNVAKLISKKIENQLYQVKEYEFYKIYNRKYEQ